MEKRIIDKKRKKNNWATKGGYTAPIMVPSTPGGELARMLREVAETESTEDVKFKIIETGGQRIKHQLQSSNPTATQGCTDSSCIACQHGKGEGGNCRTNNISRMPTVQGTRRRRKKHLCWRIVSESIHEGRRT